MRYAKTPKAQRAFAAATPHPHQPRHIQRNRFAFPKGSVALPLRYLRDFKAMTQLRAVVCLAVALTAHLVFISSASAQSASVSRLDDVQKSGQLRVCTPGDYRPFSVLKPDGAYEGIDVDLIQSAAKSLGVEVQMVKTAWATLMKDFQDKCDVAVGGISVTLDR